ncbi:MAG: biopolymer transporter ExbD [Candidatus Schekmanbacteria bacterium]|nr:biopolymer transporter ExbD [Candidatus Schekmanbacteria bacterium]
MASALDRMRPDAPPAMSEPNVIPLIDVTLVLLIIFMVITPMLQTGTAVQLPSTDQPEDIKREERQIIIPLRNDLSVYIAEDAYAKNLYGEMGKFDTKMRELFARNPSRQILIKADRRLKFGDVRTLMKHIQLSGFTDVGLISDKTRRG